MRFKLERNPDSAASDVRDRVSRVRNKLPADIDETPRKAEVPRDYARRMAREKALAVADGLVDLPQGATDLALDGEGRRLYIAVQPADQDAVARDGRVVDQEAAGGVMVKDVSDPRLPRLIEWIQRPNPGSVVREPRTGVVYDVSHSEHARRDASLPEGNLRTLLLNRLDETWEMGFSVPDGRETLAVLAQGLDDDTILAIALEMAAAVATLGASARPLAPLGPAPGVAICTKWVVIGGASAHVCSLYSSSAALR